MLFRRSALLLRASSGPSRHFSVSSRILKDLAGGKSSFDTGPAASSASFDEPLHYNKVLKPKEKASPINYENETIRKIFDDDVYWQNFSRNSKTMSIFGSVPKSGLFQNPYLTSPRGLKEFCEISIQKASDIADDMLGDKTPEALKLFITNLDRLSDTLCRVIDLAEFIRAAHPDHSYVEAAQEVHERMFEFMNVLNTNVEMYDILNAVLNDEHFASELSEEEIQVGKILLSDFEKSGTNMEPKTRENFIELSQNIAVSGQHFVNGVDIAKDENIEVSANALDGLDKHLLRDLNASQPFYRRSTYIIPLWGAVPYGFLRSSKQAQLRKRIWVDLHSAGEGQVELLEAMLKFRALLAHVMGKPSFASYQLEGKMAKEPKFVHNFLNKLGKETKELAIKELKVLAALKSEELGDPTNMSDDEIPGYLKPWDKDYYSHQHTLLRRSSNNEQISSYLSLGVVMQGLSNLLNKLYGVQLIPAKALNGETWDKGIRRLNVVSDTEGLLGVIYCDFFHRRGKSSNPAHFTICCSRTLYSNETEEDLKLIQYSESRATEEKFQMPVISVVCNFEINKSIGKCLLSLNDVETLFHEMGHAMHSMFGRTQLQNLSGTRCATDFVELPSILMEYFAKDPRVITTFSRHYFTDEPIPLSLLKSYQKEQQFLKHTESYCQIKMASLDQALHSEIVLSPDFNSTKTYHSLEKQLEIFADTNSNWHGKFGHLFGYGAMYYTYLLDRAIASKVWDHLFEKDPLNRQSGEKFKNSVLRWGGSRDPWICLSDVLDNPELASGDLRAMEIIGETKLHE